MRTQSFSADFYDTVRQHRAWWASPDAGNKKSQRNALKARLRYDLLFWPSISVTRAGVLDGACFMHTTPREICQWLGSEEGVQAPVEIFTTNNNLGEDLVQWFRLSDGAEKLYPDPMQIIPPSMIPEYFKEFSKIAAGAAASWRNIPDLLGSALGDRELGATRG